MAENPVSEAIETGIKEISRNAANPWWIIGVSLVMLLGSVLAAGYFFVKPIFDAQLHSINASMTAIESNADSNRRMSTALEKMSGTISSIDTRMADSVDRMRSTVEKLQATESDQAASLKILIETAKTTKPGG